MSNKSEQDQIDRRDSTLSSHSTSEWVRFGNTKVMKYSNEYHHKRSKNNRAVKKSREKTKESKQARELKMAMLVTENQQLTNRVDQLTKELESLKSSYRNIASNIIN
ncbi:unnamed protein product [Adineta steineri]|uniref:BZIP domain-containing protein n=1 Tax=Adineta steineri TaxID=433720 RepID=A0A815GUH9_9BILA|nr:unnamed protein product [Adineta steineri]